MGEVRYCSAEDGVRIAYTVEGEGPPLLVIPTFVESFSLQNLLGEYYQDFMRRLGRGRQLVRFDMRGTGLSEREVGDMSHAATMRDLEAVVRAAALKRISLMADGTGGPRAIEYAVRHPRLVDRLVLHGTFARLMDIFSRETLEGFAHLARANWELATRTFADTGVRRELADVGLRVAEWFRQSASGEITARFIEANIELDVTGLLPRVKASTLVIDALNDPLWNAGHRSAAQIPNARFVPLEGTVASYIGGHSDALLDTLLAFLNEGATGKGADAALSVDAGAGPMTRTVIFTDIVGHTEMMRRLGDEGGRMVLREHDRITREVLKQHGGTELKTMGDGFMASFSSVTRAVECAIALQRAFEERNEALSLTGEPLDVRVGINAGEPIQEEGDLFGQTVILAARIAAQADGGEILASLAVRELCAGKGFLFADRGEQVLRGFEDPVRMFEIRWRE